MLSFLRSYSSWQIDHDRVLNIKMEVMWCVTEGCVHLFWFYATTNPCRSCAIFSVVGTFHQNFIALQWEQICVNRSVVSSAIDWTDFNIVVVAVHKSCSEINTHCTQMESAELAFRVCMGGGATKLNTGSAVVSGLPAWWSWFPQDCRPLDNQNCNSHPCPGSPPASHPYGMKVHTRL